MNKVKTNLKYLNVNAKYVIVIIFNASMLNSNLKQLFKIS